MKSLKNKFRKFGVRLFIPTPIIVILILSVILLPTIYDRKSLPILFWGIVMYFLSERLIFIKTKQPYKMIFIIECLTIVICIPIFILKYELIITLISPFILFFSILYAIYANNE